MVEGGGITFTPMRFTPSESRLADPNPQSAGPALVHSQQLHSNGQDNISQSAPLSPDSASPESKVDSELTGTPEGRDVEQARDAGNGITQASDDANKIEERVRENGAEDRMDSTALITPTRRAASPAMDDEEGGC